MRLINNIKDYPLKSGIEKVSGYVAVNSKIILILSQIFFVILLISLNIFFLLSVFNLKNMNVISFFDTVQFIFNCRFFCKCSDNKILNARLSDYSFFTFNSFR